MSNDGKELAKVHWDWLGPLIEHVYKDAMEHGFKHGREAVTPPSPPAYKEREVEAEVRRLRTIIELAQEAVENGWNPRWELECASTPPSPPAEVPDDTASIHVTDFEENLNSPPTLTGVCAKYYLAIGKKPANSCVGCTVPGCKAKGNVETTAMERQNAD